MTTARKSVTAHAAKFVKNDVRKLVRRSTWLVTAARSVLIVAAISVN
jgi:hypothetical protein